MADEPARSMQSHLPESGLRPRAEESSIAAPQLFGQEAPVTQIGTNGDDPETAFNQTDFAIYALDGNDTIRFTSAPSNQSMPTFIDAGRGNDTIFGSSNPDVIFGGDGNDTIYGGNEAGRFQPGDTIYGGPGDDTIYTLGGDDYVLGEDGNDVIYGNFAFASDNPTIDGGSGNDIIYAGNGFGRSAIIYGGSGNDIIHGMNGAARLYGGQGNDVYEVTTEGQIVYEDTTDPYLLRLLGPEIDNVYAYVNFELPDRVENLIMVYGTQAIGFGNSTDNIIYGNDRANNIEGKGGYDTLTGGGGTDLFIVNPGWGVDAITDFVAGAGTQDAVLFSRALFNSFEQVMGNSAQVGADTYIGDGFGNTVVLLGVNRATLHQDDFAFF